MKSNIFGAMAAAVEIMELFDQQQEKAARILAEEILTDIGAIDEVNLDKPSETMDFLKSLGYEFYLYVQPRSKSIHEAVMVATTNGRTQFVKGNCTTLNLDEGTIEITGIDMEPHHLEKFKIVLDRMDRKRDQSLH